MSFTGNPYRTAQVNAASPEKILMLLYDGAVNFSNIALECIRKGDVVGKGVYINKAQAIVSEFLHTLNHDVGGDIARHLERLYIYINKELSKANLLSDEAPLANAIKILTMLRASFSDAIELKRSEAAAGVAR